MVVHVKSDSRGLSSRDLVVALDVSALISVSSSKEALKLFQKMSAEASRATTRPREDKPGI